LVVAPLSTLDHWKRTCEDWTNLNIVLFYDTDKEGREIIKGTEIMMNELSAEKG
jgi:chromodomain-helicase-DNA-binding protein 7